MVCDMIEIIRQSGTTCTSNFPGVEVKLMISSCVLVPQEEEAYAADFSWPCRGA